MRSHLSTINGYNVVWMESSGKEIVKHSAICNQWQHWGKTTGEAPRARQSAVAETALVLFRGTVTGVDTKYRINFKSKLAQA